MRHNLSRMIRRSEVEELPPGPPLRRSCTAHRSDHQCLAECMTSNVPRRQQHRSRRPLYPINADHATDTTITHRRGARCKSLHPFSPSTEPTPLNITSPAQRRGFARGALRPTGRLALRRQARREVPERGLGEYFHLRILWNPGTRRDRILLQARH